MFKNRFGYILILFIPILVKSEGSIYRDSTRAKSEDVRYCFRMTWLGPKFNNDSIFKEAPCQQFIGRSKNIPCKLPLVATYDGSVPNTTWIWDKYKSSDPMQVACRLVQGEVCAKYTYRFNDAVENITYMCTKAFEENGLAMSSGCYLQSQNGRDVQVCLCRTVPGSDYPCNNANIPFNLNITFNLLILLVPVFVGQILKF